MKKIAIIGGGISGLYFANLLQKNKNYQYKIFEKKPYFESNDGYGIQLSVNSIKLLNDIGFESVAKKESYFPSKINFYDAKNSKKICEIDISKFNYKNNIYTTLKRSTLIKFLLSNIPNNNIIQNSELTELNIKDNIDLSFLNSHSQIFDYLIVSDGIFSKTKSLIFKKEIVPKYFKSVALRASIKNIENKDISIYLGPNYHFVIYPVNQNKEFNFISIIRKKLSKEQIMDKNFFQNQEFLQSLVDEISTKTSFDFRGKIENIKSFPIFTTAKFNIPEKKNTFFTGDALYTFPPSFAQGASQSLESSYEAYKEIINDTNTYYHRRYEKIKLINSRSIINHFSFHLSNPFTVLTRNIVLKYLSKNKIFLEYYLGKVYKS